MRYETLDHTADILVKCYGRTIEECFENAAYALFDQMLDIDTVEEKIRYELSAKADDIEDRLYSFLSDLLYMFDGESAVMRSFKVSFTENEVICEAYGEQFDVKKHTPRTEIKAITYHMMNIDEKEPSVTVLFDV
jgi:SHS2 domain-containing protein